MKPLSASNEFSINLTNSKILSDYWKMVCDKRYVNFCHFHDLDKAEEF